MNFRNRIIPIWGLVLATALSAAAVEVDVNVNVKHSVGGISTFDRSKFITVHAANTSNDWEPAVMDDFIAGRDVYFGRDTGNWYMNQMVDEDPAKPGWPKVTGTDSIQAVGAYARGNDDNEPYEDRAQSSIRCEQFSPFWPGSGINNNSYSWNGPVSPWAYSTADTPSEPFGSASGFAMGHYLNEFYGTAANGYVGRPLPAYYEILNEPDYPLFDNSSDPLHGTTTWAELFDYHNTVANQIRSLNSEVKIGGFCPSHPDLGTDDFLEWNERYKLFIDMCATHMDFFSIHIYDIYDGLAADGPHIKKGSHLEATFDMIEQYSNMKKGQPLPFVVSEFGGRDRNLESYSWRPLLWTAERDWVAIKSINSMLMSFADRPNLIDKTIPFIMLKEEWGSDGSTYAHSWRLFRKENEPASYTGNWVYTDYIKFYDLWSAVNGTRVDITTSDPDIQVDAYVDGSKVYVILNNLNTTTATVDLNLFEGKGNTIQSVLEKNLYWNGSNTTLDESVHAGGLSQVLLQPEGAAVLEYTFSGAVSVDETSDEVKYYATTNLLPIVAGSTNTFQINGVGAGTYGEAVLRLSSGRNQSLSKQPTVLFNGVPLSVPTDYMGHEGDGRTIFLGQLNIPVPYDLLQESNTVAVVYPDSGGHIGSVALRAYEFSSDIRGVGPNYIPIDYYAVDGSDLILGFTNGPANSWFSLLSKTNLMDAVWATNQTELPVDSLGDGSVTNPMVLPVEFFQLLESVPPQVPGIPALFDWSEFTGAWWSNGYGYVEVDNGVSLIHGGRAAAHENGYAFKASYSQDSVDGTFIVKIGGVDQQFVVTSIDIKASTESVPNGTPMVRGMLAAVEQWAVDPAENGSFNTYTSSTTGDMSLPIDEIIWSAPYDPASSVLTWNNQIDNLAISVVQP